MLAEAERKRIEAKVAEIEALSAGEVVVAALKRCDDYHLPRALFAGAGALAVTAAIAMLWPHLAVLPLLISESAVAVVLWLASRVSLLTRFLAPQRLRDLAARARAMQIFSEHALYETRERTGVLVLVAESERRVVILGDRGIHERVGDPGWQRYCDRITTAIKDGRAADGIIAVLDELGRVMAGKLPPRPDDANELSNQVIST